MLLEIHEIFCTFLHLSQSDASLRNKLKFQIELTLWSTPDNLHGHPARLRSNYVHCDKQTKSKMYPVKVSNLNSFSNFKLYINNFLSLVDTLDSLSRPVPSLTASLSPSCFFLSLFIFCWYFFCGKINCLFVYVSIYFPSSDFKISGLKAAKKSKN